jgi:hypothetical protein
MRLWANRRQLVNKPSANPSTDSNPKTTGKVRVARDPGTIRAAQTISLLTDSFASGRGAIVLLNSCDRTSVSNCVSFRQRSLAGRGLLRLVRTLA